MKAQDPKAVHPSRIIRIDERAVHSQVDKLVRGSVEETLNQLLDAEAERLVNAGRYERSDARKDTRAGSYERTLHTKTGEVRLKVFPASKFFRALPQMVSHFRLAALPPDNDRKFRRRGLEE